MSERTATITLTETEAGQLLDHLNVSVKAGGLQNSFTAAPLGWKIKEAFNQPQPEAPVELPVKEA